jgi:hypothetical protein
MSAEDNSQDKLIEDVEAIAVEENEVVHPIETALDIYIEHIDSLYKTLFMTMSTISKTFKKTKDLVQDFEKQNCEMVGPDEDGKFTLLVHDNYIRRWSKLHQELNQIILSNKLVPASFLTSLISQYDAFLGQLIKALFDINPEMLNSSERNLSYSQLAEFDSISDAREHIVEKEIETVLRKSHAEQFDWLEKKFDLPLRKDLSIWPIFIEVTERRNLFVHTRGIVSSQYIKVCRQHGVKLPSNIKVGDELDAPAEYMIEAYSCIFDMGVQLAHVLWRKKDIKTREQADDNLNAIAFDLLLDKRYDLVKRVLDFAFSTIKKFSSEQIRRILLVNRALAYKWSGEEKIASKIINAEDWTATSDNFKLAEVVILEDYKQADILFERIGAKSDLLSINAYREWPLFLKYRDRPEFKVLFKKVFGEDLDIVKHTVSEVNDSGGQAVPETKDADIEGDIKSDEVKE